MTRPTLDELNIGQLTSLGDAAVRAGALRLAGRIYRSVLEATPGATHIMSRLGLLTHPDTQTLPTFAAVQAVETASRHLFAGRGLISWMKTVPFFEDARFMALAEKHTHLLPLANWHWHLQTVVWAVEQARGLDGDFVELGVFKGHTTLFTAEYVNFADWPRQWWLYDTFSGIPEDQLDPGWKEPNAKVYGGTFSYDEVRDRFAHIPNIRVIEGRVPEVLAVGAPDKIAFLHMDLNNATAEVQALDALFDRIVSGGIIVFDDYLWATARAQYEAEKVWFAERGLVILPLPTGQGLFVKR